MYFTILGSFQSYDNARTLCQETVRQHVIVRHRTLQTVEESGIYAEVSDKNVVIRWITLERCR